MGKESGRIEIRRIAPKCRVHVSGPGISQDYCSLWNEVLVDNGVLGGSEITRVLISSVKCKFDKQISYVIL